MKNLNISYRQKFYARFIRPNSIITLPIIVFLILHIIRPFSVGLYHDDWALFNVHILEPSEKFWEFFEFGDRPIYGWILCAMNILSNGNPVVITIISSLFVATSAYSLYQLNLRITGLVGRPIKSAASVGTAMWIAIPWGFGYSLWPTGAATLPAIILYLWSCIFTIDYITKNRNIYLVISIILTALSYLTYQATYLGFVPLLGLIVAFKSLNKASVYQILRVLIYSSIILGLSVLRTSLDTPKQIAFNIKYLFGNPLYAMPKAIIESFGDLWVFFLLLTLALMVLLVQCLAKMEKRSRCRFLLGFASCLVGIAISTTTYSCTGYVLSGTGVFSRTMISASIWLAIMFTLVVTLFISELNFCKRLYAIWVYFLLVFTMTIASGFQLTGWMRSWDRQQKILATFPTDFFSNMPSESVLLLDEPRHIGGIEVFAAHWDITSAVYMLPEMRNYARFEKRAQIVPLFTDYPMHWDGFSSLEIRPAQSLPAKKVWIYKPSNNSLRELYGESLIRPTN